MFSIKSKSVDERHFCKNERDTSTKMKTKRKRGNKNRQRRDPDTALTSKGFKRTMVNRFTEREEKTQKLH